MGHARNVAYDGTSPDTLCVENVSTLLLHAGGVCQIANGTRQVCDYFVALHANDISVTLPVAS